MKLYDAGWAPSPRRVRIFLAEKAIQVERVAIDLRTGEQLGEAYLARVPRGVVPALELDDGEIITESAAICRFFEVLHPDPPLFGVRPVEIARVESWVRRIDAEGYAAGVYAFRNGHAAFAGKALPGHWPAIAQIPELVERARVMWRGFVAALDRQLETEEWVAGDRYSYADIVALTTIDFAERAKLPLPDDAVQLARGRAAVTARPSADA